MQRQSYGNRIVNHFCVCLCSSVSCYSHIQWHIFINRFIELDILKVFWVVLIHGLVLTKNGSDKASSILILFSVFTSINPLTYCSHHHFSTINHPSTNVHPIPIQVPSQYHILYAPSTAHHPVSIEFPFKSHILHAPFFAHHPIIHYCQQPSTQTTYSLRQYTRPTSIFHWTRRHPNFHNLIFAAFSEHHRDPW